MAKERNYVSKLVEVVETFDILITYHQEVYDMKIEQENRIIRIKNRDTSYDHIFSASLDKTVETLNAWSSAKGRIFEYFPEVRTAYEKKHPLKKE